MTEPMQDGGSDAYIYINDEQGQIVGIRHYHPEQKMWSHIHFSDVPNTDLEHEIQHSLKQIYVEKIKGEVDQIRLTPE